MVAVLYDLKMTEPAKIAGSVIFYGDLTIVSTTLFLAPGDENARMIGVSG